MSRLWNGKSNVMVPSSRGSAKLGRTGTTNTTNNASTSTVASPSSLQQRFPRLTLLATPVQPARDPICPSDSNTLPFEASSTTFTYTTTIPATPLDRPREAATHEPRVGVLQAYKRL